MNLFVVELASKSIKFIVATVCFLLGKIKAEVQVLPEENADKFNFKNWEGSLESAFLELESGKVSAVQIFTEDEQFQLATIYCPKFIGEGIDEYSCIGEMKTSLRLAESKVNEIFTTMTGLTYLSLSLEEPLDINENISSESEMFPWNDWRLVLGSYNNRELKKGAAYKRLSV